MTWLAILTGGGIGAVLRYAVSLFVDQRIGAAFPWGTFTVNVVGCALIGLVMTLAEERGSLPPTWRFFLATGLLGGFTTFSTFGLETWRLLDEGRAAIAFAYAFGSLAAGVGGVVLGIAAGRQLP